MWDDLGGSVLPWRVPGCLFVGMRFRGASGLASPGSSGTCRAKRVRVRRQGVSARRLTRRGWDQSALCLRVIWGVRGACGVICLLRVAPWRQRGCSECSIGVSGM